MKIDINCDVGEGVNNEAMLMPYISSCNIACGAHAGSVDIINHVIQLAKENAVLVGAHPSFPDRENFGRTILPMPKEELQLSLEQQILLVQDLALQQDVTLHHVKPHGALYNLANTDIETAKIIIKTIQKIVPNAVLYVPYQSVIAREAIKENLQIRYEVFADRNYHNDLTLVSRKEKNAVLTNPSQVMQHLSSMLLDKRVKTITKQLVPIEADTICVHGDTQNAIELVQHIHTYLSEKGFSIGKGNHI